MTQTQYLIILGYLAVLITGFIFLRPRKEQQQKPGDNYEILIAILDSCIQREIKFKYDDYRLRDVMVIYNFKEDLSEVTVKIRSSLSETFMQDLQYYHPRDYINKYIMKNVENFLIEYTRNHKMKTM